MKLDNDAADWASEDTRNTKHLNGELEERSEDEIEEDVVGFDSRVRQRSFST